MCKHLSLIRQIKRARDFDALDFIAFECGTEHLGWLRPEFADQLLYRWPDYFYMRQGRVVLSSSLPDARARTVALAQCTRSLSLENFITGWRDETYSVLPEKGGRPLFRIERAAMRRFGLTARGVNLNAYVGAGTDLRMWIARRSMDKPIDPGLLDNLVGGGIASNYGPWDTLLKECGEEAGIPTELIVGAQPAGKVWSLHTVSAGLHSEILYIYDLSLPTSFTPVNVDGEVGDFCLVRVSELLTLIGRGEFSVEAALVVFDFLFRHDLVTARHPEFEALSRILAEIRV